MPRALALLCTYTRLIPTRTGWFHGLPSWITTCTRQVLIVQTATNSSTGCRDLVCSPLALKHWVS